MKKLLQIGALIGALAMACSGAHAQLGVLAPGHVIGNGSSTNPLAATDYPLSSVMDQALCTTQGDVPQRGASTWSCGTPSATFGNQSANQIFSGPTTGSPATPGFRALVGADIPAAALGTVGTNGGISGTLGTGNGGTGLTSLGTGVQSAFGNTVNAASGLLTYGIIGTSGATVPLLNGNNTYSGTANFTSTFQIGGSTVVGRATNAAFGAMEGDGTTINCVAGICTAVGAAASSVGVGTTTVTTAPASNCILNAGTVSGGTGTLTCLTQPPFSFLNCALSASVGSNLLTVSLTDNSGATPSTSSPCQIAFRNSTAANGSWVLDSVTGSNSISTNATGATLGSSNNIPFRLWVVAFDNGGTVVLALYNASSATSCDGIAEGVVQSSTGISGSATSTGVFYTPNGTSLTNKAIKILGYLDYSSGLTTAGSYATGPTGIQSMGFGVYRPCETVQTQGGSTTSSTSNNTTSYAATNLTVSLTPHSTINPVLVQFNGPMQESTAGSFCYARIQRGGTAIGRATTVFLGAPAAVGLVTGGAKSAFDQPQSVSSQTYTVYMRSGTASDSCVFPDTNGEGGGDISATEIMGMLTTPANDNAPSASAAA